MLLGILILLGFNFALLAPTEDQDTKLASEIVFLEKKIKTQKVFDKAWNFAFGLKNLNENRLNNITTLRSLREKLKRHMITAEDENLLFYLYGAAFKIESLIKALEEKDLRSDIKKHDAFIVKSILAVYSEDHSIENTSSLKQGFEELVFKQPVQ